MNRFTGGLSKGALERRFDAVVIGSGASGSIAVKELTEMGLDVLLLEAGRDITSEDFRPSPPSAPRAMGVGLGPRVRAALRGQPVQARRAFFNPAVSAFLVNDRENPYTTPPGESFLWVRGRILGGRLHTYGRMLLRMSPYDFGGPPLSEDGATWPISYSEIEPWYDRVEEFIGLYGNNDGLEQLPDGRYRGPAKLSAAEEDFKAKVEANWPERRVISWRYAAPNPGRVPLGIQAARDTGRLTTRTDAVVRQITTDGKTGRATGALFVDRLTKQEHRVTADVVVLCASTIESVRLLLNSPSARHPGGLANSSRLLGRYFMDQTPSLVFGSVPDRLGYVPTPDSAPPDEFYAPAGGCYIPRWQNLGQKTDSEFETGFAVQGAIGRMPVPENMPAPFGMMAFGEMLPRFENRIMLDPRKRDRWAVAAPHLRCTIDDNERALLHRQVRAVREMAEYCGYRVSFAGSALGLDARRVLPDADPVSRFLFRRNFAKSLAIGAAIHECGGARMGSDPATSIVNAFNQSWDVPNLFITDASCFVTSGSVGPTLTIMALTARACEYIGREHATGALHGRAAS